MTLRVQWRTASAGVYNKEYLYYENIREGLGQDLELQVEVSLQRIVTHPYLWTAVTRNVRRILVHRFPFIIYYKVHKDWIEVIGFRHAVMKQGKFTKRK